MRRLLLVEDNPIDAQAVRIALDHAADGEPVEVDHHTRLASARPHLVEGYHDCLLLDLDLPDSTGMDTLRTVLACAPRLPVVVLTGRDNPSSGVEAIAAGAQDYLNKDEVTPPLLVRAIRYAMARHDAAEELRRRSVELAEANRRLRQAEARLRDRADHDALTGTLTRWAFEERATAELSQLTARGRGFGLFFCDLDRFKAVNDRLGHPVGDQVLVACARRLVASVRGTDLIGRLGGDEFMVLSPGLSDPGLLTAIARRLVRDIGAPISAGVHEVHVGISVGIVVRPDGRSPGPVDLGGLIGRADQAMYRAKAAGGGRWHLVEEAAAPAAPTAPPPAEGPPAMAVRRNGS